MPTADSTRASAANSPTSNKIEPLLPHGAGDDLIVCLDVRQWQILVNRPDGVLDGLAHPGRVTGSPNYQRHVG